jgi:hypothetical protein
MKSTSGESICFSCEKGIQVMEPTVPMLGQVKQRDKFITQGIEKFDDVEEAGVLLVAPVETGFGQNVIDFPGFE